jgi:uncharacterized protein YdaU (DUF1376 family)
MPNKPPAFQKYAQDWLVGTAHLSLEAQGAYERLICHEWVDGPLPNDPPHLAKLLGVTAKRFARIWGELARHFPVQEDGRLANPRLEFERQKQVGYRLVQSMKGKASVEARLKLGSGSVQPRGEPKVNLSFSSSSSTPTERSTHRSQLRRASPVAIGVMLTQGERPTA